MSNYMIAAAEPLFVTLNSVEKLNYPKILNIISRMA